MHGDRVSGADAAIDPEIRAFIGKNEMADRADRRQEIMRRVFGVNPRLDGMAVDVEIGPAFRQDLAVRDADLPFDQIEPGNIFRHRMLDLKSRIHFHEIEVAGRVEQEFHGSRAAIIDGAGGGGCRIIHALPQGIGQAGSGCLLYDLLVPALDRAIALEKRDTIAVAIGKDLHFHMPWPFEIFLDQHAVIAEGGKRLALCAGKLCRKVAFLPHDAHALAAATGRGFEQNGITDGLRLAAQPFFCLILPVIAGNDGNAGLRHQRFRFAFPAHGADCCGRRADENEPGSGAGFGEAGIFGEETVTGMNGLRAGRFCGGADFFAVEIGGTRRRGADGNCLVGQCHMHGVTVGVRINGDSADAHAAGSADDAAGDFAPVGDQYFREHRRLTS